MTFSKNTQIKSWEKTWDFAFFVTKHPKKARNKKNQEEHDKEEKTRTRLRMSKKITIFAADLLN